MTLSDFIKQYRLSQNLSQRQFAAKCGTSHGYISVIERGINPNTGEPVVPSLTTLKLIANGMNMSLNDLFNRVDDMPISLNSSTPDEREILFNSLPPDKQEQALAYMRFLIGEVEK